MGVGGDATNWDEENYRRYILQERELRFRTVFRSIFAPSQNPKPDILVVASGDGSLASYSLASCISSKLYLTLIVVHRHFQRNLTRGDGNRHNGPAYDVKFYGNGEDSLLLRSPDFTPSHIEHLNYFVEMMVEFGDGGGKKFWSQEYLCLDKTKLFLEYSDLAIPVSKLTSPWGALSPIPENNAIAVDTQGGSVVSAAGDSCAYLWDVVCTDLDCGFYASVIPAVRLYFEVENVVKLSVLKTIPDRRMLPHGSVPLLLMQAKAGCEIVTLFFAQILAVGAEPFLTRFNISGTVLSQIQCAPQSAFSVSLHPSGVCSLFFSPAPSAKNPGLYGTQSIIECPFIAAKVRGGSHTIDCFVIPFTHMVTSVGGYGGLVDVISEFGSHLCTFRCRDMNEEVEILVN
ncbi:hypothetical protein ACLOJK_040006 [Asimina triloba]